MAKVKDVKKVPFAKMGGNAQVAKDRASGMANAFLVDVKPVRLDNPLLQAMSQSALPMQQSAVVFNVGERDVEVHTFDNITPQLQAKLDALLK